MGNRLGTCLDPIHQPLAPAFRQGCAWPATDSARQSPAPRAVAPTAPRPGEKRACDSGGYAKAHEFLDSAAGFTGRVSAVLAGCDFDEVLAGRKAVERNLDLRRCARRLWGGHSQIVHGLASTIQYSRLDR